MNDIELAATISRRGPGSESNPDPTELDRLAASLDYLESNYSEPAAFDPGQSHIREVGSALARQPELSRQG